MKQQHQHGGARKGAGRKPAHNPMKRRSISMLPEDWDKAKALAESEDVSVDEILRRLLRATSDTAPAPKRAAKETRE